jgi:hypothetical protein
MMLRKYFLELVCVLTLVSSFSGVVKAESTTTAESDWFLTATKSAVSSSLDILAKTGILPLAHAGLYCSIECGHVIKDNCEINCSPGEQANCRCVSCGVFGSGLCSKCSCTR